ncbi:DUF3558 domain-containing protein [Streptomyces sp. NBC_00102]|uniref:DUF3558 domain-containing protein n=1 Tax=Streptomyces sp. NBC_00102 TaxID=2975652 RepID=UPI00225822CC|nr:DUF3558 domain-containing protein [Streptomyces sp. NBC_00102]MCX5398852.1 DUF3558 domain-containing protein [Streptomyces sp. NBC_00102]
MHRSAPRLSRILLCAAVPVMLVAAGCSSDSGDAKEKSAGSGSTASGSSSAAASASPTVEPAKFAGLPDACKAVSAKTVKKLVPSAKKASGTLGKSSDEDARSSCSWNGLDDKGVKGSVYHWLDIGLVRYDSEETLGSGADRATTDYTKSVAKAQAAEGAKSLKSAPVSGIGDQATAITYTLNKTSEDFSYATIVVRTANVVVSVNYNGTGYAGAKAPSVADITAGAQTAAKEVVAAVGGGTGGSTDSGSASPSATTSASPKTSSSKSAAASDSPKTSSSESAGSDDEGTTDSDSGATAKATPKATTKS